MSSRRWLMLILSLYLLITVAYGVLNPLFEAPDEHWHFFTAVYIAENQTLPVVEEEYDTWLSQEAAQPPLYYILSAGLIAPLDTSTAREEVWLNPFGTQGIGNAAALVNKNQMVHTAVEQWPWQEYVLAAHILRIFSTFLGLGTLLAINGCARLLWPQNDRLPLLAVAIVAFLPQFNFLHAAISNDTLVIFLCSVALWQLLWLWQHEPDTKRLLLLGITIGLAVLSKNAGVLLLIFAVGFLALNHLKEKSADFADGRRLSFSTFATWGWQTAVYIILPVLLIAGWLWWRNWQLYGDWTATNQFIRIAGGDRDFTLWQVLGESGGLWRSLFGVFGWFNLLAPTWAYMVWYILAGLGILGLFRIIGDWRLETGDFSQSLISNLQSFGSAQDKSLISPPLLLFGWLLAVYAGLLLFMLQTPAAQGRLLFPAIVPLALGLAAGLHRWRWFDWLAPAAALVTTIFCLWGVIRPAYALPPLVDSLPTTATPLNLRFDELTLLGIEIETETAVPNETITFTLYWQADAVPEIAPELVVDVLGRRLEPLANSHSYHGRGLYPATEWPTGAIVADQIEMRLTDEADPPVLAQLFVRLVDETSQEAPSVAVGEVVVLPTSWPEPANEILAEIGGAVQVSGVTVSTRQTQPGETITVNVSWQIIASPQAEWTTLLHLAQPGEPPLATGDSPPLAGDYPTRVWVAGQRFSDAYQLMVPEGLANGRYPLWLGMYNSNTIERLPLTTDGERQPTDLLQIGWLEIVDP
ncbi:glycosyltransferase family 39 protein [Candidatus Leptofilum sp.]|uniref:glycosyltransferase family 39 protein n=1 Tax=Candidatus Leptofilum sp. TaxID=3241576 RepID=UPI003B5A8D33